MNVTNKETTATYLPIQVFTTADIGCERGNNIINPVNKLFSPLSGEYVKMFNQVWNDKNLLQDVTEVVLEGITAAYQENSPKFIYFVAIYNIFNEFLEDTREDVPPNEAAGFKESKIWGKLYDFQHDATLAIINKLEKYKGASLRTVWALAKHSRHFRSSNITNSATAWCLYYALKSCPITGTHSKKKC